MSRRLKMLPAFFMLIAGTITSIITYLLHYETKLALTILLGVLLLFYFIGLLFQWMLIQFEKQINEAEEKRLLAEGTVFERDGENSQENKENSQKDGQYTPTFEVTGQDAEEMRE